ncbi:MAG: pyridoxal phosphate-dependent aminotransferase, partial [Candidatus Anammoxibacter sp.]
MKEFTAERVDGLMPSGIRMITRKCDDVNGINLGQGVCDEPTPKEIKDAAVQAILSDKNTYSKYEGIDELRECIAVKMARYNKIKCDAFTDVTVNAGSTGGFVASCLAFINPGDEVVLFEPFYGYHLNILRLCKANIKYVKLSPPDWAFDYDSLKKMVTDKTKAIIINTPNNPTGKVFSKNELTFIADICQKNGVLAIADEMYEYILYDNNEHISIGSLPGMEDLTITISGFSKSYNTTGWRLGYTVAKKKFTEK